MAIFPIIENEDINLDIIEDRGINFLYDFELEDFVLKDGKFIELTGDAGVIFWIEKTLKTEYEKAEVYKFTEYGTELESLRGLVMPYEISRNILETNIKNALLKHERINSIDNFEIENIEEKVYISFEVTLNPITQELTGIVGTSLEGFTRISTLEEIKDFLGIKLLTNERFYFKTSLGNQVYIN